MNEELLTKEGSVLCAVSGGVDSMYLLCRLRELGYKVSAAHFNHRLRGAESDRDEAFVRAFCQKAGVPFYAGSADVTAYARENGLGTEDAARRLRYAFLERTADETGAALIATAHTADDNAETVLLNLARGAGLRGLGGIPPRRGRIVRPMLEVTRAEAEAYLTEKGVPHVEDSTNASDDYARNRVRHGAVPVLKTVNPSFPKAAARAAALLRQDEAYLEEQARAFLTRCGQEGGVNAAALLEQPFPISSRAVRLLAGRELTAEHVRSVLRTARSGGCADLPGGLRAERRGGTLRFGAAPAPRLSDRPIVPDGWTELPESGLVLRCQKGRTCPDVYNKFNIFFFSCENICGNMTVGARREGDVLRTAGRGCTKPVRRLLAEAGVSARDRDAVPVIRDEAGVLAVYGVGTAQRVCAGPGQTDTIQIEIMRPPHEGERI